MADVVIENPVINSPYVEPKRHFVFGRDGITGEIADARRRSSYFVPIAAPRRQAAQLTLEAEWTLDRIKENDSINRIREEVARWRDGGYQGVTTITRRLLEYWQRPERDRPLFFCQIEAAETAIFLGEVATRHGVTWIENEIRARSQEYGNALPRLAYKIATGGGKTVVMAMFIAWHTLNKGANRQDRRFSDAFLVVTPGITIRDRLRVLLPNEPDNFYRAMDVVSMDQMEDLQHAVVEITNYHAFLQRDKVEAARLTKVILAKDGDARALRETKEEVARRVCRAFAGKRGIVVINDEAHHCYRHKLEVEPERLSADEKREIAEEQRTAEVWISGLEAVAQRSGIRACYDLSATPFFLRGSGYPEGTLFPWVVSDFSLIDAIESGIVKVPRVPVADNKVDPKGPVYRNLWPLIRAGLSKRSRATAAGGEPHLPAELEGALRTLYANYNETFERWQEAEMATPPVFIVVCSNTSVSKQIFDFIAGWNLTVADGTVRVVPPPATPLFSNVEEGRWAARPKTILIDSAQLESGEALSADFKKMAATEIEELRESFALRTGRPRDDLTDQDVLREVMNTVGKSGKLGEQVRCVVSVSMLTEGWDASTVTHILGVRAFGTQLLCEQVVGRGLRRSSYVPNDDGMFDPQYAEVFGVPFSFLPTAGIDRPVRPPVIPTRVCALPERAELEISFPRVVGYHYDFPTERLEARFSRDSLMSLSPMDLPTEVEARPAVGEYIWHDLDLATERLQEVTFQLAKRVLDSHFVDADGGRKAWLFPQLVRISRRWMEECLQCKDDAFPQMLLVTELQQRATEHIHRAIVAASTGDKRLLPILDPDQPTATTAAVDFETIKPVYSTTKSHVSHVTGDSGWEHKLTQTLEDMPEVIAYVKNQGLGLAIPYTSDGLSHAYWPDFVVRGRNAYGEVVNLIIEVTGERRRAKSAKAETARDIWVPAINANGGFGRWTFLEIEDPYTAKSTIREALQSGAAAAV